MILIGKITQFAEQKSYPIIVNEKSLLLIHQLDDYYLIENKCGHFGVKLDDASIKNSEIICKQHGISFSLKTGTVINRPYENCDPIKIYSIKIDNDKLFCINLA